MASKLAIFDGLKLVFMKKILMISFLVATTFSMCSCSKCYDCVETQDIYDANGNIIDQTEVTESVCTADSEEISNREANGGSMLKLT